MLFIHDYLRYLRTEWNATVTVQLNRNCLLTVTWTVDLGLLSRRVADGARAAACDPQHCWRRVCLWPRQCTSTSHSWQSRTSAPWDTPVHQSWHAASQQSLLQPGWLLHLGHNAETCVSSTNPRYGRIAAAACWDMSWISAERIVDDAINQWRKNLETCIYEDWRCWSLWTLAVTLLAWHATSHTIHQPALFTATSAAQHNSPFLSQRLEGNNIPSEWVLHFTR